jgi:hypothetical protein
MAGGVKFSKEYFRKWPSQEVNKPKQKIYLQGRGDGLTRLGPGM